MRDAIIVLNTGSSSLKFSMYGMPRTAGGMLQLWRRGLVEGLGASPRLTVRDNEGQVLKDAVLGRPGSRFGHVEAFEHVVQWMREHEAEGMTVVAVGHRITHGGEHFARPTLIDDGVLAELEKLIPLAPLHQPHNLAAVKAVAGLRRNLPQVACFDTAFHHGRARVAQRMGLPDAMFSSGVRRWGFHGLSYQYITTRLRQLAPELSGGRVIVAHLGNGASLCAIKDGRSMDTTMGFSVLDGLPMGTRCGSLDPGVILFLLGQGWNVERIESLLYRESGLLGISGISSDLRDLLVSDSPQAAEAIDYFVYRLVREIGSLTAILGGLDVLTFTAGIGENSTLIRQRVCRELAWLGITIDTDANQRGHGRVSIEGQRPAVWVIPTDEEHVIAQHTLAVVNSVASTEVRSCD